jgi:Protein of unknown function (DUF3800)
VTVNLISYADESGTHDPTGVHHGSEVALVAGWIADKAVWDNDFEPQWQSVLDRYGVRVPFRMSEFMDKINGPNNPDWPYLGWSDDIRNAFMMELIPVARDSSRFAVGGAVNVQDYDRILPEWIKDDAQHPYTFCFQLLLNVLLPYLESSLEPPLGPDDQVGFFFDQQKEFEKRARLAFHRVKTLRDYKNRMGALAFVDKRKYLPLQAADLLAYLIRSAQARRIKTGFREFLFVPGNWESEIICALFVLLIATGVLINRRVAEASG